MSKRKINHVLLLRRAQLFAAIIVSLLSGQVAEGETLDDLRGLSLEMKSDIDTTYRNREGKVEMPVHQHGILRLYVSLNLNVFEHQEFINHFGIHRTWERITHLEKTAAVRSGIELLQTWTLDEGHLTKITQQLEGYEIMTITVDRAGLTCTAEGKIYSSSTTGRFRAYSAVDDKPVEIYARAYSSITCTVRKGNVFAAE